MRMKSDGWNYTSATGTTNASDEYILHKKQQTLAHCLPLIGCDFYSETIAHRPLAGILSDTWLCTPVP